MRGSRRAGRFVGARGRRRQSTAQLMPLTAARTRAREEYAEAPVGRVARMTLTVQDAREQWCASTTTCGHRARDWHIASATSRVTTKNVPTSSRHVDDAAEHGLEHARRDEAIPALVASAPARKDSDAVLPGRREQGRNRLRCVLRNPHPSPRTSSRRRSAGRRARPHVARRCEPATGRRLVGRLRQAAAQRSRSHPGSHPPPAAVETSTPRRPSPGGSAARAPAVSQRSGIRAPRWSHRVPPP